MRYPNGEGERNKFQPWGASFKKCQTRTPPVRILLNRRVEKDKETKQLFITKGLSNINVRQRNLMGLIKHRFRGPVSRVSGSAGLGYKPVSVLLFSNKFPGDAHVLVRATTVPVTLKSSCTLESARKY